MTHDDETVERVARAIYEARPTVWAETREPTTMPSPAYETVIRPIPWLELVDGAESDGHYSSAVRETRHIARAALSAMPDAALLREALEALQVFAEIGATNWTLRECPEHMTCDIDQSDILRARAAADKIRAALGEKP